MVFMQDNLPDLKEFPQSFLLDMEKETLGIYVSGHPLAPYEKELKLISNISTLEIYTELEKDSNEIQDIKDGQRVKIGGIVVEKKNKITKNNNMMAFITLEDFFGTIECIVFPKTYQNYNRVLDDNELIIIEGKLSISEVEEPKIICEKIMPLNKLKLNKLYIQITKDKNSNIFNRINSILKKDSGNTPVYLFRKYKANVSSR